MLISLDGSSPRAHPTSYVHTTAQVIGDVEIGADSSIWFNCVVRGDVHYIRIGERTNIQDNSTVHVTSGRHPTILGDDVTIGHGAILHGCQIGHRSLVGIGSIVLDRCHIGEDCMVAAGSVVAPGTVVEAGTLVLGQPAKPIRRLRPEERAQLLESAHGYVANAERYRSQGIV